MKRAGLIAFALLGLAWIGWQDIPGEFLQRDRVHIKDFGGIPDDSKDDTKAYYAAYAQVIKTGVKQYEIILDAGTYNFDRPLLVGAGSGFASMSLTGKGGYAEGATGVTVLDFSEDDSQLGIVIQGGRNVTIKNIVVQGANTDPDTITVNQTDTSTMTDVEADWVTAGLSVGQHNPYAGVAIDPFSGTAPADRYDSIVDPNTSKTLCDYGASSTVRVVLDQVNCNNWVVGFAVKPADNDSNADTISAYNCTSRSCAYGWSNGGSQNRGVNLYSHFFFCNMVGVETATHGRQTGAPPALIGGECVFTHTLFKINNGYGHISVNGFYGETLHSLGYFGRAGAGLQMSASVTGSHFKFRDTPSAITATDANDSAVHLRAYMTTHFSGCTFSTQRGVFNVVGGNNEVLFDACEWNTIDSNWADIYYMGLVDAWGSPRILTRSSTFYTAGLYSPNATRWNCPDTESVVQTIPARFDLSLHSRRVQGPTYTMSVENSGAASGRTRISATSSTYNWTGAQVSFTASNGTDFAVGDILYWQTKADTLAFNLQYLVPALKVSAINSNTITADAIVGVNNLNTSYAPSSVGIAYRPYAHGAAVTGTTASSTSITNVTSASSYFKVGDFISGNGIPAKTRVTNVSGTTVTISKSATASASNVFLYCDHVWRDDVPHDSANAFWAAQDAATDDAKPVMACLDYWGKCQLLGGTQYAISTIIDQPANSLLVGYGMDNTTLKATAGFLGPIVRPAGQATIRDLRLLGRDEATSVGLQPLSTGVDVLADRVDVRDFATGVLIDSTGMANFKFSNGRIDSCTSNGASITVAVSNPSFTNSVIQSNTTAGINATAGMANLKVTGNIIGSNGTGVIGSGSLLATLISGNYFNANTTADVSISGNARSTLVSGNNFASSPICFTASNGNGTTIQANTFNPSGGSTKSITLTSTSAVRTTIGQNVYIAGAFDYNTDNSGLQTRYLGSFYSSGSPTQGVWEKGEQVLNSSTTTSLSTPMGWNCTTAGDAAGAGVFTPFYRAPQVLVGSGTWDPGSLATGASESVNVTISGGVVGSVALAGHTAIVSGMTLNAVVTSSSNVRVTLTNVNATNPTDLSSGTVNVQVFQ